MADDLYERYKEALRTGHVAVLRGSLESAIGAYRTASEIAPARALPHTSLGGVYLRLGHLEEALNEFAAAVERAPHDEGALLGQAEALTAAGMRSDAAAALDHVAEIQEASGRLPEAADTLRRAIELEEIPDRIRRQRALLREIRFAAGDHAAEQLLARALRLRDEPGPPPAVTPPLPPIAAVVERQMVGDIEPPIPSIAPTSAVEAEPAVEPMAVESSTVEPEIASEVEVEPEPVEVEPEPVEIEVEPEVAAEVEFEPEREAEPVAEIEVQPEPVERVPVEVEPAVVPVEAAAAEETQRPILWEPEAFLHPAAAADAMEIAPASEPVPQVPELASAQTAGAVEESAPVGVMTGVDGPPAERQPGGDELLAAAEMADRAGDGEALHALLLKTARAYAQEGRYEAALDATHRLLSRAPGDVDAHLLLVELYVARSWDGLAVEKLRLLGRLADLNDDAATRQHLCEVATTTFPEDPSLQQLCS